MLTKVKHGIPRLFYFSNFTNEDIRVQLFSRQFEQCAFFIVQVDQIFIKT
jgi:hypothetical protein